MPLAEKKSPYSWKEAGLDLISVTFLLYEDGTPRCCSGFSQSPKNFDTERNKLVIKLSYTMEFLQAQLEVSNGNRRFCMSLILPAFSFGVKMLTGCFIC